MSGLRILRIAEVVTKTGRSRTRIYVAMAAGTFPRQVRVGPNTVGWLESDIDRWILDRARESQAAAAPKPSN